MGVGADLQRAGRAGSVLLLWRVLATFATHIGERGEKEKRRTWKQISKRKLGEIRVRETDNELERWSLGGRLDEVKMC